MCSPNSTSYNFIKEKKNHEHNFQNIKEEKQETTHHEAHHTICLK